MEDIKEKENEEQAKTLREDYSIGMDGFGEFAVEYRASCGECQFKYNYDYTIAIDIGGKK